MNFVRKIGIAMMAAIMAVTMMTGCKTECVPAPEQDTASVASILNDAQKYNDFDVKVNYTFDQTLETAMKQAIEDDKLVANDTSAIASLMNLDVVDETALFGVKTTDDGTIKEGTQTVMYVFDDNSYKGLTDETFVKAIANAANNKYEYLNTELDGKQVVDTTGTYDVKWKFDYAGKAAMVKHTDEDGNNTRYITVILTCTTTASKTLAD